MNIRAVTVYCASSPRAPRAYLEAAGQMGRALANADLTLVYGGGSRGVMGALADGALEAGGCVIGVRPSFMSQFEEPHPSATEMIVTETMHQRKQILYDRADAFVTLPGSIGTLDETIETLTWKRLGKHNKPVCILNVNGYFDPLLAQFERLVAEDMVADGFLSTYRACATVADVMAQLHNHVAANARPVMWETP